MQLFFLIFISQLSLNSQTSNPPIVVTVSGIEEITGVIRISLFDDEETFLNHSFKRIHMKISTLEIKAVFENVPDGNYAVSIYHDKNSNGKLDSNMFRIPKEPYGFSNNPSTMFGPPDFEGASFSHGKEEVTQINIQLK